VKRLGELLLVLLLSGCAALPVPETAPATSNPATVTDWTITGRISLTRGEEGWHAGLDWENRADRYHLQVTGPLGQGALQLSGTPAGVTLIDSEARVHAARDVDALLAQVTGWDIPVAGMQYWVRGVSAPDGAARISLDPQGRLQQLEQSGWVIIYQRYRSIGGYDWPSRLKLVHDDLAVRLVIDQWQLDTLPAPSVDLTP
jgi:outer membrane lipoprotein LolB